VYKESNLKSHFLASTDIENDATADLARHPILALVRPRSLLLESSMPVVLETSKRLLSTSSSSAAAAASTVSAAMKMRKSSSSNVPPAVDDPTAWLIHGTLADIVLMNTYYIKCMVILAYTFLHGTFVDAHAPLVGLTRCGV
jgi:hypothetical protein